MKIKEFIALNVNRRAAAAVAERAAYTLKRCGAAAALVYNDRGEFFCAIDLHKCALPARRRRIEAAAEYLPAGRTFFAFTPADVYPITGTCEG